MKNNLLKTLALALVMTPLYNCSVDSTDQLQEELDSAILISSMSSVYVCVNEDPKSRITNNSDNIVDFEIHDATGALVNFVYGLNPGETSDYKTFGVGLTTFTVSTSESTKPVRIDMGLCMAYDVAIDEYNQLNTSIPIQL
jgi:hypothetical protein